MTKPATRPPLIDAELQRQMVEVHRHLHRNPELSNEESETQAYLERALRNAGLEDVRMAAGFGLAVDIHGTGGGGTAGRADRRLAIRADIDALPIAETSGLAYASAVPGVMHACGHDAHSAMCYAAAVLLNRRRDSFAGTARIIFQPAEEAEPLGGRRVVEEGLLDDITAAIGIHVDPRTPAGKVAVSAGPCTLACDTFDIVIGGRSSHAANPSEGVDAIIVACTMVSEFQKIVSREINPYFPLVISVTGIEGGGAYNVIASEARLKGTIRSGHESTRQQAWTRLRQVAQGVASCHNAVAEVEILRGEPAVINDAAMVDLIRDSSHAILGDGSTLNPPGWTAADDFGFYAEKCPSVFFRLGIRNEEIGAVYPLHHPRFRIDEGVLASGAAILAHASVRFLTR